MERFKQRLALVLVLILTLVPLASTINSSSVTEAAVRTPFTIRYSANDTGDIVFVGNTLMTCSTSAAGCEQALSSGNGSNNSFDMQYVDIDSVQSTFNSSSSDFTLPSGGEVLWAGLYWGGRYNGNEDHDNVLFQTPIDSTYQSVTGDIVGTYSSFYHAFEDVTGLVQAAGSGTYSVANVQADVNDVDRYAAWSLIIAYKDPSAPPRNLTVFDGFADITNSSGTVDVTVSGFQTPPGGQVNAFTGVLSYEGDGGLTGDSLQIQPNGTGPFNTLSDGLNPETNFFNGTISRFGQHVATKQPNFANQLTIDLDVVDVTGILDNGDTSATLRFTTGGETYIPGAIFTAVELYAPNVTVDKSVRDVNGGDVAPGDILEYTIDVTNSGQDYADNTVLTDAIPANTTYVPGSLNVVSGPNSGMMTDATGDDQAEFDNVNGQVVFRLGNGASSSAGGTLNLGTEADNASQVTFRVQVDNTITTTTEIDNQAIADYVGRFGGNHFTSLSPLASVTVVLPTVQSADLSVTKSSSPSPYVPGDALSYTIVVTNDGPGDATGVEVSDVLPPVLAGFTWTCVADTGSSCAVEDGAGNIDTTVDLEAGDSATFTLTGTVPSSATGQIENTVTITPPDTVEDPDTTDQTSTDQNDPAPRADLSITKTDNADSATPGEPISYTIEVSNAGPSDANGATITDSVPADITNVQWACNPTGTAGCGAASGSGNDVNTTANLPAGTTVIYTVTGTVSPSASGSLENTATVTAPDDVTDPDDDNNSSSDTNTLTPTADVSVVKSSPTDSYVPGSSISYTIVVTNSGPSNVQGITVTDTVPDDLTNVTWSCQADSGSSCAATTGSGDINTTVDLESGSQATFTVTADVLSSATGQLSNTATVTVPGDVDDPDPGNNGSTVENNPEPRADLQVTKSSTPNPYTPGEDLIYTIVVTNNGPSDVAGATVTDNLPDVLANISWTCAADDGSACAAGSGNGDINTTVDLQSGDSATFTVSADAPSSATEILANDAIANVPSGVTDPNPGNNRDHDQNPFDLVADLSITKDDGSASVVAGTEIEYTIVVTNNGPSDVNGATISDSVPASITDVTWTCQASGFASCGAGSGSGNSINTTANLPSGDSVTYIVSGTVDPSATGALENFASVGVPDNVNDPNDDNDSDSDISTITTQADVSVTKTSTPESYVPGAPLSYTITVTNSGPSDVAGVLVTDDLPPVIESFTWTCAPEAGSSCATAFASGDISTTVDLASGESAVFTVSGTVPSNANTRIDNTVNVSVPPDVDDPNPDNNTTTNENEPTPTSDLSITKSSSPNPYVPGLLMTYTIKVTNNGPTDVVDAIVTDNLPAALESAFTWTCVADPGSNCDVASGSGDINATVDLEAGDSAIFTSSGTTPSGPIQQLENIAEVIVPDGVTDPDPTDNTARDENPSDPTSDVSVTKTSSPESYVPGAPITYTITVFNSGPSDVDGVTVTDNVPDALTNISWTCQPDLGSQCAVTSGTGDINTTVDLESGDRATFTVTGDVPSSLTGQLINEVTAEVPDDVTDPDPGNNTTTNTSDPDPIVDLSVSKSSNPNPYVPGEALTYTIVVTNNGLSDVIGATVNDDVPAVLDGFSWTCVADDGSSCAADSGVGDIITTVNLQAGDSATFTFTGIVPSSAVEQFSNTVNVDVPDGVTDPQEGNNTSTDMNPSNPVADLAITKTDNSDTAVPGESITYTIVVSNPGPSDAPGASIIDTVPASITDVTWICEASGTATCGADSGSGNAISTTADLPAGTSVTYTVTGMISSAAIGTLSNTASVDVPADVTDPIRTNNTSTDTNELTPTADVSVSKVSTPNPYIPGRSMTYTIVVSNDGPSDVTGVTVTDTVPDILAAFEWTCVADDGSSCAAESGTGNINTTVDLQAGDTATFTLQGVVPSSATELLSNTVTIDVPDGVIDPDPENNTSTEESEPFFISDVSVTKTSDPEAYVPGETLTYTIIVVNDGPSDVVGVAVVDDLPDVLEHFTWTCVADDGSSCGVEEGAGDINTTVDLQAGDTATITVQGIVASNVIETLSNTATATVPDTVNDPNEDNNSSTDESEANPIADLAVTKTSSPSPFVPGDDLTYTIVVTNAGPSDATGVTVSDDLPESLENFSWTCEAEAGSACAVESGTGDIETTVDVAAGGSVTFILTGNAPFGTGGSLSNTVTVTVPEGVTDPDPSNNSATADDGSDPLAPDCYNFDIGYHSIFFPWVGNDDPSTGLGNADTSVTVQNLTDYESFVVGWVGIGDDSLPGNNGWDVVGPFYLEAHASKTFSAAELGIADGDGAPIAFSGFNVPLPDDTIVPVEDLNDDGDTSDYEIIAESSGSWLNPDGTLVTWSDDDCLVIDVDGMSMSVLPLTSLTDPAYCLDAEFSLADGKEFKQHATLGGYAKQAVDGENLPYTSEADSAVSGYNAVSGWELTECDLGWYLPIVQTNGGPGGAWNSIIRVANFGDTFGGGFIGAAGVTVAVYPADNGGGELGKSYSFNLSINAGQTKYIDLSDHVPEGFVGSAHILADAPVFAMVDRVKVGYSDWITNTATNATLEPRPDGNYVLYAPDVRKDWFGWNTGINVANMADSDTTVTIQYLGDSGAAAQTADLHARGMTYFYDPSQGPQDNSAQEPAMDVNADEIGAAIIISDGPVAVAVDATKYPESTTSNDPNVFQALSYSATRNLFTEQFVPLVQKGDPDTGMGATSGIQIFNPNNALGHATVYWHLPSGDLFGNAVDVVVNPNAMTFVYTMSDAQLSTGYLGSADVFSDVPVSTVSTQVDYQVEFDGSAVWNGYNPCGGYRTISEQCEVR